MIASLEQNGRADQRASVRAAIANAASSTGVDFSYLLAQANSESGLNPSAQAASSSAAGLYQFIDQSWLGVLKKHGSEHGFGWAADAIQQRGGRWQVTDGSLKRAVFALRKDPTASALMAGAFASDNAAGLSQALGRAPSGTDLYFAHFLGLGGATRFLQAKDASPDASAASLFPREASANSGIFYSKSGAPRSLSEVYALMANKLDRAGGAADGTPVDAGDRTAGQVQLAVADADDVATGQTAQSLVMRGLNDVLRPDPKHAMLAYRMIAASLS